MIKFRKAQARNEQRSCGRFIFKARSPTQTMNALDEYLRSLGDEPVRWLAREVRSWGNEFSYTELAAAIEAGNLDALIDWQERYAEIVNGHLAPLWAAAIAEASKQATRGMTVLSDSNDYVRGWINTHGGKLITRLSDESRLAVMNVILRGQGLRMAPRDVAKEVRPLIGLNDRQAAANQKYRNEIFNRYRESGMSESKAAERAEQAALKYAGKQHRYRAETIVLTENAYAYNRGAHMSVCQSIADGYMGRCAMIWTTAGTNRVCSRCLALKDTVVGYTDELGVLLPPLHPRCRCAIMYDEVGTPRATRPKPTINPLLPAAVATEIISPATPEPQTEPKPSGSNYPLVLPNGATPQDESETAFPAKFIPAKSIIEANEFAVKTLGIEKAEYKGCAVAVANEWNFGLLETFEKFPELKKYIRFVGEAHERNAAIESKLIDYYTQAITKQHPNSEITLIKQSAEFYASRNMEKIKISKEQVAVYWNPTTPMLKIFSGVVVNREFGKNYETFKAMLEYAVHDKQRPVGCSSVRSCLDHEIGHLLDDLLNLNSLPEIQELYESRVQVINRKKDFSKITNDLSRYAWKNVTENRYAEFIADAWAEYCNNPTPREIAQKVGEIIEREYKKKFL